MSRQSQSNIVVIFSDQLRRDALGAFGDPNISTPNIDALARSGVSFRNACSTYPICVPFRFTLMTGAYAHSRFVPSIEWRMSPAERTLADDLNDAGYETVYVGKWHLYGGHAHLPGHSTLKANRTPVPRHHQGRWQKWYGFELRNDPYDTCYFVDDDPTPRLMQKYQTDGCFDLAMDHIGNREDDRPFCCVISVEPPHFAYVAPPELEEKWRKQEIELPPNFFARDEREQDEFIEKRQIYYAMVENLDMNVGRLLDFLAETGLDANTVVVLFSDHGEMGGSQGLNPPVKGYPYEESIGIPLIVRDPSIPGRAGQVLQDPTCTEDLFPTLLGLANLTPRNDLPGLNLAPLIRGEENSLAREGVLLEFVAEFRPRAPFHEQTWRGFRSAHFKYTVLGDVQGGEPWQFYDLETDPYEMTNLVDHPDYAHEVRRHHGLLRDRLVATGDHYVLKPAFGYEGLNTWY